MLLAQQHRARVKGLLIYKFRGEVAALHPGPALMAKGTGCPVAGVLPHLCDLYLAAEDVGALEPDRQFGWGRW